MRIVISTLVHGRQDTVLRCWQLNKEAGIRDFTCSYSDSKDKELAETIADHVCQSENIIPTKAQKSLELTRDIEKDAVLLMGSDDYVDGKCYALICRLLENHDYIGFTSLYFEQGEKMWLWPGYPPSYYRHGEPAGAGKVVRADLLEKMNYKVFGNTDHFTDFQSHKALMENAENPVFVDCHTEGVLLVDVKDQGSRTPLSRFDYLVEIK